MDSGHNRKVLVRGRVRVGQRRLSVAVMTAVALVGVGGTAGAATAAAQVSSATSGLPLVASTDPNVTAQVHSDVSRAAQLEGSVEHLGLSCPVNSEFELDLAYVRDALNQGNILGARAYWSTR